MFAKSPINHLTDKCDGLDNNDTVDIRLVMTLWWGGYHGVLDFILHMYKGKKKAACANIPKKYAYMVAIATCSIQST